MRLFLARLSTRARNVVFSTIYSQFSDFRTFHKYGRVVGVTRYSENFLNTFPSRFEPDCIANFHGEKNGLEINDSLGGRSCAHVSECARIFVTNCMWLVAWYATSILNSFRKSC